MKQPEAERRDEEERERSHIVALLAKHDISLDDATQEAVIDQTMLFRTRTNELVERNPAATAERRKELRAAFKILAHDYHAAIRRIMPDDLAGRVVNCVGYPRGSEKQ